MRVCVELFDGALLCHFVNALFPGAVVDIDETGADEATPRNFAAFVSTMKFCYLVHALSTPLYVCSGRHACSLVSQRRSS